MLIVLLVGGYVDPNVIAWNYQWPENRLVGFVLCWVVSGC